MLQKKYSRNMSFEKFLGHSVNIPSNSIPHSLKTMQGQWYPLIRESDSIELNI